MIATKTTQIIFVFSGIVIAASIVVMIGWLLDLAVLKSIIPGFVTMKFSTALSFFFSGWILFFAVHLQHEPRGFAQVFLPIVTMVNLMIMSILLISIIFGLRSGLESLFVRETTEAVFTLRPGLPSIGTVVNFILIGLVGLFAMSQANTLQNSYYIFSGCVVLLVAAIALIGYATSQPVLFYHIENISSGMAIHTAVLFGMLGSCLLLLNASSQQKSS